MEVPATQGWALPPPRSPACRGDFRCPLFAHVLIQLLYLASYDFSHETESGIMRSLCILVERLLVRGTAGTGEQEMGTVLAPLGAAV